MADNAFFSFLADEPRSPSHAPAIDDFVAQHVASHPVPDAPGPSNDHNDDTIAASSSNHKSNATAIPAGTSLSSELIHPLIRNRSLDTPEDIAAWIAERKSKYPTDANIRLKAKVPEHEHSGGSKRKRNNSSNPLSALVGYGGGSDSDNSPASQASDDESSDSAPEETSTKSRGPPVPFRPSGMAPSEDRRKLRVCKFFARGACTKGSKCPFAHPEATAPAAEVEAHPPKSSSLLEMLMAKDIERENHRVWQCIDYICSKDFLDVPSAHIRMF
ncbi:hypothetical protein LPJ70_000129 [Coemansia sp. RSA 2708]|nr:hypothetical protein LPJ70_000129 [Coemansia sp. RSA 2708]